MTKIQAWIEENRKLVFDTPWRKIEEVTFDIPTTRAKYHAIIKAERNAASIVGITTDKQVVLVKQFRPGPKEVLDELPGGFVESDETAKETARREFIEETGYDGDFEFVGTCIDDGYSTMIRYCFVAKDCKKIGEPQNDKVEMTEVVLLSLEDFRKRLRAGKLTDVEMGYLGLDYLGLL